MESDLDRVDRARADLAWTSPASKAVVAPPHGPWMPAGGRAEPWKGYADASTGRARLASTSVVTGQDPTRAVDSHHLRAARALLGWAMSDLARVSGLSLSTIRRLEQNAHAVSVRNHRSAVDALRMGGIRFLPLDDGTIALGELAHWSASTRMIAAED